MAFRGSHGRVSMAESKEDRYRSLFEGSPAVMLIIDPEDGSIVEVNQAAVDFYGWPREELLGRRVGQINVLGEEEVKASMTETVAERRKHFDARHRLANGGVCDVEVHSGLIALGGKKFLFSIIHDMSSRFAAERERDELSSRLGHYLATSPTVTYSLRIKDGEARWQWASENIADLLGYAVEEVLVPDWWIRNIRSSDRMRALGGISKLAGNESFGQEYRFLRKDRTEVWLRDEMRFAGRVGGEAEIVGTLTDISERKKVEGELSLKSQALEAAANAIAITDREGTTRWVNSAFEKLTGYSRAEAIGENPRILKSGAQDAAFYRELWDRILAAQAWQGQVVNRKKSGELYVEEMTITPVLDDSGRVNGFIAIKSDMTEHEESKKRLLASLAEKEELLREIHHRNHNTMQLIMSLLQLSIRQMSEPALKDAISGISRRILAIAQVHEQFYGSEDMARIDLTTFLRRCAVDLRAEYPGYRGSILVESSAESVFLSLEKAIPAGIIAAELISNALRHAYPEGREQGNILVELKRRAFEVELSVRDYGVGMSADAAGSDRLGMTLIHILAKQLGGSAEFRSSKGMEAVVRFPQPEEQIAKGSHHGEG
jgi:PAS domain S-box-containing protein